MRNTVHVAIQIVPISKQPLYPIIDKAIEILERTGADYRVGAMETVIQGDYEEIMHLIKKMQETCLDNGADQILVNIKVHAKKLADVTWDEKLAKYE